MSSKVLYMESALQAPAGAPRRHTVNQFGALARREICCSEAERLHTSTYVLRSRQIRQCSASACGKNILQVTANSWIPAASVPQCACLPLLCACSIEAAAGDGWLPPHLQSSINAHWLDTICFHPGAQNGFQVGLGIIVQKRGISRPKSYLLQILLCRQWSHLHSNAHDDAVAVTCKHVPRRVSSTTLITSRL